MVVYKAPGCSKGSELKRSLKFMLRAQEAHRWASHGTATTSHQHLYDTVVKFGHLITLKCSYCTQAIYQPSQMVRGPVMQCLRCSKAHKWHHMHCILMHTSTWCAWALVYLLIYLETDWICSFVTHLTNFCPPTGSCSVWDIARPIEELGKGHKEFGCTRWVASHPIVTNSLIKEIFWSITMDLLSYRMHHWWLVLDMKQRHAEKAR